MKNEDFWAALAKLRRQPRWDGYIPADLLFLRQVRLGQPKMEKNLLRDVLKTRDHEKKEAVNLQIEEQKRTGCLFSCGSCVVDIYVLPKKALCHGP